MLNDFRNDDSLWRLRVDLFAPEEQDVQGRLAQALISRLAGFDNPRLLVAVGVDSGTGMPEGRPLLGATFWIKADTIGSAVQLGVGLVKESFHDVSQDDFRIYDVVVVPNAAVTVPVPERFPPTSD